MVVGQTSRRIEVAAARIAIEWKDEFATKLKRAAEQLATDGDLVTVDHYRQALPDVLSEMLQRARNESGESPHGQRQVA